MPPEAEALPERARPESRREGQLYLTAYGLALAVAIGAGILGHRSGLRGLRLAAGVLALLLLLLPFFALGMAGFAERLRALLAARRGSVFLVAAPLLVPYLFLVGASGAVEGWPLVKIALYVLVPAALLFFADRSDPRPGWLEALAIAALWIPMDYRLVQDAWPLPSGSGAHALHTVLAVDLVLILFVAYRGLEGVGWSFRVGPGGVRAVLLNFVIFVAIGVPIGLWTGFLAWNPQTTSLPALALQFVTILLFTGLPEELLFRGIIQNGLRQTLLSRRAALLLASVLFGVAHLNNGPFPDWRYALLATLAGIFYGRVYDRTGSLMAPACLHALVDTTWGAFLHT